MVAAMLGHAGVDAIQWFGCQALSNIAGLPETSSMVAAAGGIEAVLAAMRGHAGVADIQKEGCHALSTIAVLGENQLRAAAEGGIEVIVAAMWAHPGVAAIQENGCRALGNIAWLAENVVMMVAAGGIEAVVAAMRSHSGIAAIQEFGCLVLLRFAGTAVNKQRVIAAGGLEAAICAVGLAAQSSRRLLGWLCSGPVLPTASTALQSRMDALNTASPTAREDEIAMIVRFAEAASVKWTESAAAESWRGAAAQSTAASAAQRLRHAMEPLVAAAVADMARSAGGQREHSALFSALAAKARADLAFAAAGDALGKRGEEIGKIRTALAGGGEGDARVLLFVLAAARRSHALSGCEAADAAVAGARKAVVDAAAAAQAALQRLAMEPWA